MPIGMHDSLTEGDRDYGLRAAMLIYMSPDGALVTAHDVESGGPSPLLTAGFPLDRETAAALARCVHGAMPTRTLLPPEVLMWDGLRLAWWVPARRRPIWFHPDERPQLRHVSRCEVLHPALLFVAEAGRLHLHALAADERPTAETAIFQAPYLNTYEDGWVCGQTVTWPTLGPEHLAEWEEAFFRAQGTKVWAQRLTLFPGGHDALWSAMREAERFPAESLVPTGWTVLDAINYARPASYPQPQPREEIVPARALP